MTQRMSHGSKRFPTHHGYGELRPSRYVALYLAQAGWLVLGWYLYSIAFWPSTCTPENLLDVYPCALRLNETGDWPEAALFTWLFVTPILVALEISRRMRKGED
jgi:hypothetical protein